MKTAEETINRIVLTGFDLPDAINLIKEYAKQVAEQALKDAAENANLFLIDHYGNRFYQKIIITSSDENIAVNKESIINTEIKTP